MVALTGIERVKSQCNPVRLRPSCSLEVDAGSPPLGPAARNVRGVSGMLARLRKIRGSGRTVDKFQLGKILKMPLCVRFVAAANRSVRPRRQPRVSGQHAVTFARGLRPNLPVSREWVTLSARQPHPPHLDQRKHESDEE